MSETDPFGSDNRRVETSNISFQPLDTISSSRYPWSRLQQLVEFSSSEVSARVLILLLPLNVLRIQFCSCFSKRTCLAMLQTVPLLLQFLDRW